jgi:hypothetical protein
MNSTLCEKECPSSDDGGGGCDAAETNGDCPINATTSGTCNKLNNIYPSACDGGCVVMSNELYPWMDGDTLYGYIAQEYNDSDRSKGMGDVYKLTVKPEYGWLGQETITAYVQVINTGMLSDNIICDFLIPGGGVGINDGCNKMPEWDYSYLSGNSEQFGGIRFGIDLNTAFGNDQAAIDCVNDILFNGNIFTGEEYGTYSGNSLITVEEAINGNDTNYDTQIRALAEKSGIWPANNNSKVVGDNGTEGKMSHYWDCCKPNVTSNPNSDTYSPTNTNLDDDACNRGWKCGRVVYQTTDGTNTFSQTGNGSCITSGGSGGGCFDSGGGAQSETDCTTCVNGNHAWFDNSGCFVK